MGQVAQTLGIPATFTFEGRSWKVGVTAFEAEGAFERYCEQAARDAIIRHRKDMDPAEFAAHMSAWRQDCGCGLYDWDQHLCLVKRLTLAGRKELAFISLCYHNPDQRPSRELVERLFKDAAKLAEYEALAAAVNADPNRQGGPAPAAA